MTTTTFDSLGYAKKLEAAGFTRQQAEAQAEAIQGVVRQYDEASRKGLVTKGDLHDVRTELKEEIANTKHEILKWVLGMIVAQTTLIITAIGVGVALLNR